MEKESFSQIAEPFPKGFCASILVEREKLLDSQGSLQGWANSEVPLSQSDDARQTLLDVRNLRKSFVIRKGWLSRGLLGAVNGISFRLQPSETLGIVGESGCGKSTLARCIVGLLPVTEGEIYFHNIDLARLSPAQFGPYRSRIQLVLQDPTDALNPRMMVWRLLDEPLHLHTALSRSERLDRVLSILEVVGLAGEHLRRYPHQLSTGQQQRVNVARAVICSPELVVLDEPTSALDVSVRGRLLELLKDIQTRTGVAYVFVSHDLSVIRNFCDRVGVMYLGFLVELAPTRALFSNPLHPYTQALISAIPIPDPRKKRKRLMLEGEVPSPLDLPKGCPFQTRCPVKDERCIMERPNLMEYEADHWVASYCVGRHLNTTAPRLGRYENPVSLATDGLEGQA